VGLSLLFACGASVAAVLLSKELARAEKAEHAADEEKEATTDQLWKASLAQAQAIRLSGRIGQRFESLEAIQRAASITHARGSPPIESLALRSEAIACLALADLRVMNQWPIASSRPSANFDATQARYVQADEEGNIHVARTVDQIEVASFPGPGRPFESLSVEFSRDGRFLLALYDFGLGGRLNLVWEASPSRKPSTSSPPYERLGPIHAE
jgi:hypothetical protein